MSSKRAKYTGPFDEVVVSWPPGETAYSQQQHWTVAANHWLPDDAPAKLRDELTAGPDFTDVEYTPPGTKKDGEN